MFIIDDVIGGLFSLGSAAIGANAQRGAINKQIKLETQQAKASQDEIKSVVILLVGGTAVLTVAYLGAKLFESV